MAISVIIPTFNNVEYLEECINSDIIFLSLPTPYQESTAEYDKSAIVETLTFLAIESFTGLVVLKSTVEPETTVNLSGVFSGLSIMHNPEFLTERTALVDFNNQSHIVLGTGPSCGGGQLKKQLISILSFIQTLRYLSVVLLSLKA